MTRGNKLLLFTGALIASMLFVTGTASAQIAGYSMTGQWFANRGPLVDIPANGGPVTCIGAPQTPVGCINVRNLTPARGATAGGGRFGNVTTPLGATNANWTSPIRPEFRPLNGGVPGSAASVVMVPNAGAHPGFIIPPGAFGQAAGSATVTVNVPTVIQLATNFTLSGPPAPAQVPTSTVPAANQPAGFTTNAWSKDPGQTARLAPAFSWCPGVGGGCTIGTAAGTLNNVVRYSNTNPDNFGGTMAMLLKGFGFLSIRGAPAPGAPSNFTKKQEFANIPIGPNPTFVPQAPGKGYGLNDPDVLGSAIFKSGYNLTTNGLVASYGPTVFLMIPTGNGSITVPKAAPAEINVNWGFPWTTGTVQVQNVEVTGFGAAGTTTMTAMGNDGRGPFQAGQVTLVAGGLSHREPSKNNFAALDVVTFQFSPIYKTPSMTFPGMATLALLLMLSVGFMFRNRLARSLQG